jgi:NADPH:quinone reductase-like Zn-dependent oxidoreductase
MSNARRLVTSVCRGELRRIHADQEVMPSQTGQDVKNKVLVAGASGLIGAAAIETFLAAGWDVIGISRRKPDLPVGAIFGLSPHKTLAG